MVSAVNYEVPNPVGCTFNLETKMQYELHVNGSNCFSITLNLTLGSWIFNGFPVQAEVRACSVQVL